MRVNKILNNNLVLSKNEDNEEIIVKGLGIGYHAKRGDKIDESLIEKIFYPKNHQNSIQMQQYLLSIPEEYFDFVQKFVDHVKEEAPNLRLNNSIYLSLSDHILGTVERFRNGISLKNVLLLDIQQLYKKEYEYGMKMVDEINRTFQTKLPVDEAGFIALHFVNAEEGQHNTDNYKIAMIVNQVQEIVKNYFSDITFNESSLYYQRFLTHLKYFAQRYLHKELQYDEDENLFQLIQEQCREAYGCVKLIYLMMEEKYQYALSKEEMMYLSIHIQTNVDKSRAALKKVSEAKEGTNGPE
ncbi:MAG: PRD domain-containing protein [Lachnospiraceae bacterium]|nr:PRD domain-containing protein [Lachnospiraceae bacterium]